MNSCPSTIDDTQMANRPDFIIDVGDAENHRYDEDTIFDACIIGSGAAGSIVAYHLVQAGWKVLVLEIGSTASKNNNYWSAVNEQGNKAFVRRKGRWIRDGVPWTTCNVGGGTIYYGGASFRFREVDFDPSRYINSDLDVRWPIGYDEIAPYYEAVESLLPVSHCNALDPTLPSLDHSNESAGALQRPTLSGKHIFEGASKLGLNPFPTPLAINFGGHGAATTCSYCSTCIGTPCPSNARADAKSRFLEPITSRRNFTLVDNIAAKSIEIDSRKNARRIKCICLKSGREVSYISGIFILAANAIQSAALLLRSCSRFSPEGLGNELGLVGRGLCFKLSMYIAGFVFSPVSVLTEDLRGPFSSISITDYYLTNNKDEQLGGLIYEAKDAEHSISENGKLQIRLEAMIGDTPRSRNRVKLTRECGEYGLTILALDYQRSRADMNRLKILTGQAEQILEAAGATGITAINSEHHLGRGHLHGTCRAGHNPAHSVVNAYGRLHNVDNVFVVDGGYFPYPGSVNPTLTIQANALRIAEHISGFSVNRLMAQSS